MGRYEFGDLSFEPPHAWQDRTIAAFVAPPAEGGSPNVVVAREPRRPGDALQTHAQRQLVEMASRLSDFEMLESEDLEVAGRRAILTRFSFRGARGVLEQTLVHVDSEGDAPVTTFTFTAPSPSKGLRHDLDAVLASVRFGAPKPASLPTPIPPSGPRQAAPTMPSFPMPGRSLRR